MSEPSGNVGPPTLVPAPAFSMRWFKEKLCDAEFDRVLVFFLLLFGFGLFLLHLAYERPARRTATLAVELLRQARQGSQPSVDEGLRGVGGEIAIETAIINALASETRYSAFSEGALHLGFACLVSAALIIMVENVSKRKFRSEMENSRHEIARNVWKAVFERDIPVKIVDEIIGMLSTKVVKKGCVYTITLSPPYAGMPKDKIVIRHDLSYELHNIGSDIEKHEIVAFATKEPAVTGQDRDGTQITFPRQITLQINEETKKTTDRELTDPVLLDERKYAISLQPGRGSSVVISGEQAENIEACKSTYSQLTMVVGLTVNVVNQYQERVTKVGVRFNHPHWNKVKEAPRGTFPYPGGVLPGQGFTVIWQVVPPEAKGGAGTTPPQGSPTS